MLCSARTQAHEIRSTTPLSNSFTKVKTTQQHDDSVARSCGSESDQSSDVPDGLRSYLDGWQGQITSRRRTYFEGQESARGLESKTRAGCEDDVNISPPTEFEAHGGRNSTENDGKFGEADDEVGSKRPRSSLRFSAGQLEAFREQYLT